MSLESQGYKVERSRNSAGYQYTCPAGFTFYNFWTEEEARADALDHLRVKKLKLSLDLKGE